MLESEDGRRGSSVFDRCESIISEGRVGISSDARGLVAVVYPISVSMARRVATASPMFGTSIKRCCTYCLKKHVCIIINQSRSNN